MRIVTTGIGDLAVLQVDPLASGEHVDMVGYLYLSVESLAVRVVFVGRCAHENDRGIWDGGFG
jgi:hypothetical protein